MTATEGPRCPECRVVLHPCTDCGQPVPVILTGDGLNRAQCPVALRNEHLARTGQTSHRVPREVYEAVRLS